MGTIPQFENVFEFGKIFSKFGEVSKMGEFDKNGIFFLMFLHLTKISEYDINLKIVSR